MRLTFLCSLSLLAAMIVPNFAHAQYAPRDVEQLQTREKPKRDDRPSGPVTAIRPGALLLASFDQNADYSVHLVEFRAGQAAAFTAADTDDSGSLNLFELEAWRVKSLGSLSAPPGNFAFDRNIDQVITRVEFDDALQEMFDRADDNDDQIVEFSEMVRVFSMSRNGLEDRSAEREVRPQRGEGRRGGRRIAP
ncbi:hypothetical protein ACJ3XI_08045 [Litorimonas sp. RW-G-Af-16]|uniref:hypothetical protein n=1 Tax=Litorimonas sp. RW-G-Af-16 TaxID=3241168 RepID=UPI00390C9AD1